MPTSFSAGAFLRPLPLMDKKYTLFGVLFIAAAVALMIYGVKHPPPAPPPPPAEQATTTPPAGPEGQPPQTTIGPETVAPSAAPGQPVTLPSATPQTNSLFAPLEPPHPDAQIVTLANDYIEARFTNYGGAIASIALKKHPEKQGSDEPLTLNAVHHAPVLALAGFAGADSAQRYEQVSTSADEVVYRTVVHDQLEITRRYTISRDPDQQDPYVIRNETTLRNLGGNVVNLPARFAINLGTGQLVHDSDSATYLNVGRFDGSKLRLTPRSSLDESSGFLGMIGGHPAQPYLENDGPTVWATVENQFFATIVTPDKPGTGVSLRRVELPPADDNPSARYGLTGELLMESRTVPAGSTDALKFEIYAGPKEYARLARLGEKRDKVMNWGSITGPIAKILLLLLTALHSFIGNWGFAIIATTLVLRTAMWPLTGMGTRAAKRMAKIQGPLKEIQEKYKDNRTKQQEETIKLFKANKVNPLGGCLPLLVQMPIFFGLFSMLRSASELRLASFLWIPDLSAPDTVAHVPGIGFPINIIPVLMGVSMVLQMRLSPSPTTDNQSAKMMKFMPYIFTAMCYNYSSGLALYWTTSNMFTIFQQWVTNRSKDPVETTPVKPGAAERAKPVHGARVSSTRDGKKKR